VQIQLAVLDTEHVSTRPREQPRLLRWRRERFAQPRDLNPQRMNRRIDRLIAQELVDQPLTSHDPVRAAQQQRQQSPLAGPADLHRSAVAADLQRPQDSELQPSAHGPLHSSLPEVRGNRQRSERCDAIET
jgi:hypothetical protein